MQGAALVAARWRCSTPWQARADAAMDAKIEALVPDLEAYIAQGMTDFDVPGLAIGIVTGDRLVYAKGFGVAARAASRSTPRPSSRSARPPRRSSPPRSRSPSTRSKLAWDDRVVDLYPDFQLKDPWVTRRVPRLRPDGPALGAAALRQRRGRPARLRPAGDDPVAAPRRAGVELPHDLHLHQHHPHAGRSGSWRGRWAPRTGTTWSRAEIFEPLGMTDTSLTAEAIEAAAERHARLPLDAGRARSRCRSPRSSPTASAAPGAINSTVDDIANWVRLQLARRQLRGRRRSSRRRTSPSTRTPRVGLERHGRLRHGLDAAVDAERPDHLAQRRHHRLRRLRRHRARQGRRA